MASNLPQGGHSAQPNAAPGIQGASQPIPGYNAAMFNLMNQWLSYGLQAMTQSQVPTMPGLAPGFFTPPSIPHVPSPS